MAESTIIFISGGVRSGKSSFAEQLAAEEAKKTGGQLHYIAAGQASDSEMKERILRHQKDRLDSGLNWKTWEKPNELQEFSGFFTDTDIILLDCLTTLLNNEFFSVDEQWMKLEFQQKVMQGILEGIKQISQNCHRLIIVSNEVLNESQGSNELVFIYRRMLGQLHQQIVAKAKQAYLVEAGIPILMKGKE
ncbi:bifunctional adenosylcobinamide kinase/adenosylcobinamide-phosphate guanylyltransferase [Bacillus sp. DTU_2020_1000418_1_SI_GHA_SEK_038]|uniref:bifunctional adenosylcobinamide kinase/adenosylcobinamide-phosphate guanylyltransferase n=1 Tax=Bacillus sp. DTU_2020_1000418_1_SI_GHA_SEK_038 TaxID=3077585 RepID=UPI0028E9C3AC|nr:bifunctional adenosylcobinamide kinase/adenosylcobinamide-phosphate guanylyltransferase [Bacillus sp. DTU_2020_1000418_1_SI_GHA_SEK_038]WNS75912.1 bifunctional adenosylcobinamide kinase/adenosylcobinamide-phosphate guanylyltransferase [Bacillus sp. DTU_2020_1000418_1_SI_GHA_SEK_038]